MHTHSTMHGGTVHAQENAKRNGRPGRVLGTAIETYLEKRRKNKTQAGVQSTDRQPTDKRKLANSYLVGGNKLQFLENSRRGLLRKGSHGLFRENKEKKRVKEPGKAWRRRVIPHKKDFDIQFIPSVWGFFTPPEKGSAKNEPLFRVFVTFEGETQINWSNTGRRAPSIDYTLWTSNNVNNGFTTTFRRISPWSWAGAVPI